MGSQMIHKARHESPAAIVVNVDGEWFIAEFKDAEQPDRTGGGCGPVVLTYKTKGKPYRSEVAAQTDAVLPLKRQEDEQRDGPFDRRNR